jgi:sterol desaturase/sphingolipid hydroxylase (fatty acid hydroxylase superfamily)
VLARLDAVALDRPLLAGIGDRRARFVADIAVGLLLFELGGYAYHRLAHAVPALWRLHEVHHSSETMDWLASFRQHPLEIVLVTLAQNAPLVLLGVPLGAHATVLVALKLATVFVHANVRVPIGPLRFLVATPRFHHRHHQRDGAVANFASFLPALDLLFGSHSDQTTDRFGVDRALPDSFVGLLLAPFRRAR